MFPPYLLLSPGLVDVRLTDDAQRPPRAVPPLLGSGFPFHHSFYFIIFLGVGGFLPEVRHVTYEARWSMSTSIGCGRYVSAFLGRSFRILARYVHVEYHRFAVRLHPPPPLTRASIRPRPCRSFGEYFMIGRWCGTVYRIYSRPGSFQLRRCSGLVRIFPEGSLLCLILG